MYAGEKLFGSFVVATCSQRSTLVYVLALLVSLSTGEVGEPCRVEVEEQREGGEAGRCNGVSFSDLTAA